MYILITFVVFFLSIAAIVALRLTRPGVSFTWLGAAGGGLLAWISVLLWQLGLPRQFTLGQWSPQTLFSASPQLLANPLSWLYALSLCGLAAAVILTSPARGAQVATASWLGTLALTSLGLVAVLVDNPIGLVLAWMAMDLTELALAVRSRPTAALSRSVVLAFSVRMAGIGFAVWASVFGTSSGLPFSLETAPPQAGIFLLVAAGLRLGVLPLHLVSLDDPSLRRGFGTVLRMTGAVTGLMVLSRIPSGSLDSRWLLPLLAIAALAALYAGWRWLFSSDELIGSPYWVIGMGALSLTASLSGNPAGATAWGVALILFGGISCLYSSKQTGFTRALAVLGVLMLAFPFTLTASGWQGVLPFSGLFLPLFLIAHAMLVAGYVRHILRPVEIQLAELPSWAQAVYPVGLGILVMTVLLAGLWGWPGALNAGQGPIGVVSLLLCAGILVVLRRVPQLSVTRSFRPVAFAGAGLGTWIGVIPRLIQWAYELTGDFLAYVSGLLEGDGGLLWTLLLLVLLSIFLRGR